MERRAETEGFAGVAEVFRNSTPAFAGRGLPGFEEPIEQIPALVERGKKRLARFYRRIDGQLADNRFIAGPRFSVADITALCIVDFATRGAKVGLPEESRQRPALARRGFRPPEHRALASPRYTLAGLSLAARRGTP